MVFLRNVFVSFSCRIFQRMLFKPRLTVTHTHIYAQTCMCAQTHIYLLKVFKKYLYWVCIYQGKNMIKTLSVNVLENISLITKHINSVSFLLLNTP